MNNLLPPYLKNIEATTSDRLVDFTRRILIIVGIVVIVGLLLAFLYYGFDVVLLAFSGILLAIVIRSLSDILRDHTPLSDKWSVSISLLLMIGAIGLSTVFLVPRIGGQVDVLTQTVPQSIQDVRDYLNQYGIGSFLRGQELEPSQLLSGQVAMVSSRIAGIFSTTIGIITSVTVVFFTGLFLAFEPRMYIDGFIKLVPPKGRARTRQILTALDYTLRWWLIARVLSMVIIAVLTFLGLWLLDVPLALTLGILTGLLTFIPIIGATLAIIPPMLIAFTQEPILALYVLGFYLLLQTVESYLITPLVQERAISLPSALMILFQLFFGAVAGILGIALAAPVLAVIIVVVKMVYVQDILDDSVPVRGLPAEASS
ncbi:MAG: AI-2E family transporter [Anaerolineae bacterium]|nr:AI-2E family transporter [Anaerolineae bacterium]